MFQFVRNFFRRRMNPIEPSVARKYNEKFSLMYAVLAWNIIGFTAYFMLNERVPRNRDSIDYMKLLGVTNATVVKYSGLKKVDEIDVSLTDEEIQAFHNAYKEKKDSSVDTTSEKEMQETVE